MIYVQSNLYVENMIFFNSVKNVNKMALDIISIDINDTIFQLCFCLVNYYAPYI